MPERFQPIINEEDLEEAIHYVAEKSLELARLVVGSELSTDTICFFAHNEAEHEFLRKAVMARGPVSKFSHGPTLYVDTDFTVHDQNIRIFGVREPDPTRTQVGYGDYPVKDYERLQKMAIINPHMEEITSGRGKSLIELRHPDFDVLGYLVDVKDHLK